MAKLYLIDAFNSTLNSSRIVDVIEYIPALYPNNFATPLRGCFCVNVGSDLVLSGTIQNYGDLVTSKYNAITELAMSKASLGGHIIYDEMTDYSVGKYTGTSGIIGARKSFRLPYPFSVTPNNLLTAQTLLSSPTTMVFRTEWFYYTYSNVTGAPISVTYNDFTTDTSYIDVSFDNGAHYVTYGDGVSSIGGLNQGNHLILKFYASDIHTTPTTKLGLNSWSIVY